MPFHWNYVAGTGKNDKFELFLPKRREPSGRIRLNGPEGTSLWVKLVFEFLEKTLGHSIGIKQLVQANMTNSSYFYRNGVGQVAKFGQIDRMAHHCGPKFYLSTLKRFFAIPLELCSWYGQK